MPTDLLGNPHSVSEPASQAAVDAFVHGFMASELGVLRLLDVAPHDDHPLVQALTAVLQMFAEAPGALAAAAPHLARAQAWAQTHSSSLVPREQQWMDAAQAWVDGDVPQAMARLEAIVSAHPRDLAAVKLGQYLAFNLGDSATMLRLAQHALPAAADVPYLHGMNAFALEQCHRLDEAEASARRAIALVRKEPWAHHAVAHVTLTQGRVDEGLDFMRAHADTWVGLNSFMYTHNWWHIGLFLLERGETDAALALYDRHLWGAPDGVSAYSQDQIGAVSMLARIELAGGDVGERWQVLRPWLLPRVADQVLPFADLHYLYGLARAGDAAADTMLAHMTAHAERVSRTAPWAHATWRDVALPAAHGLLAHARGQWAEARDALSRALPQLVVIGGSHAQRDWFERMQRDATQRARHRTH